MIPSELASRFHEGLKDYMGMLYPIMALVLMDSLHNFLL